jgi:hypothetical protein
VLALGAGPAAAEQLDLYRGRLSVTLPDGTFSRLPNETLEGELHGADRVFASAGVPGLIIRSRQGAEVTGGLLEVLGRRHADAVARTIACYAKAWCRLTAGTGTSSGTSRPACFRRARLVVFTAVINGEAVDPNTDPVPQSVVGSLMVR